MSPHKSPHIFYSNQCLWTKRKGASKRAGNPNKSEQMMEQLTTYIHGDIATSCVRDTKCVHVVVWLCMCFRNMTSNSTQKHLLAAHQPKFIQKTNISQCSKAKCLAGTYYSDSTILMFTTKVNEKKKQTLFQIGPMNLQNFGVSG